jgi:hypothetical protein
MQGVLATLLEILETANFDRSPAASLSRVWQSLNYSQAASEAAAGVIAELSPQQPCPVCAATERARNYYLEALLGHLTGPNDLAAAYRASDGFCLPHFRLALAHVTNEECFTALVEAQQAVWQRLNADLREFIRKNDYHFIEEGFGEEGDSWRRAIEAISGAPPAKIKR